MEAYIREKDICEKKVSLRANNKCRWANSNPHSKTGQDYHGPFIFYCLIFLLVLFSLFTQPIPISEIGRNIHLKVTSRALIFATITNPNQLTDLSFSRLWRYSFQVSFSSIQALLFPIFFHTNCCSSKIVRDRRSNLISSIISLQFY